MNDQTGDQKQEFVNNNLNKYQDEQSSKLFQVQHDLNKQQSQKIVFTLHMNMIFHIS